MASRQSNRIWLQPRQDFVMPTHGPCVERILPRETVGDEASRPGLIVASTPQVIAMGSFDPETIFDWIRFASTSTWSVEDPRLLRRDLGMVRVLSSKPHQKRGSRR